MPVNKNEKTAEVSNRPQDEQAKHVGRRLDGRSQSGETRLDVVERLLDETAEDMPIEEVIHDLMGQFDDVASLDVSHPDPESPTLLGFTVYTGEAAGCEEEIDIYDSGRVRAVTETTSGERFASSFYAVATMYGPSGLNTSSKTCVYMKDGGTRAEPRSVEEGLTLLRQKFGKSHDELESFNRSEPQPSR